MSLFIANSAFSGALLDTAKASILVASLLAGGIGFALLRLTTEGHDELSQLGGSEATS
jgi:Na+/H+ antiporter NhaA